MEDCSGRKLAQIFGGSKYSTFTRGYCTMKWTIVNQNKTNASSFDFCTKKSSPSRAKTMKAECNAFCMVYYVSSFILNSYQCSMQKLKPTRNAAAPYFLANEIFIACVGVILKPCRASLAAPLCSSVANSTKAISWRFGTKRTSLKPGN